MSSTIELNEGQQEAIKAIGAWHFNILRGAKTSRPFILNGYAGTGKTTLIPSIVSDLGVSNVLLCSFTSKAARVMSNKVGLSASTIHSAIYYFVEDQEIRAKQMALEERRKTLESAPENAKPVIRKQLATLETQVVELMRLRHQFRKRDRLRESYDLIICDECSMVDERLHTDLASFGIPIIYIGDPGQLPPVNAKPFLSRWEADYTLETICRQAEGNTILQAATSARCGEIIPYGNDGNFAHCQQFPVKLPPAGVILAWTNSQRRKINATIRRQLGLNTILPQEGEPVICRRNTPDRGVFNGMIYSVVKVIQHSNGTVEMDLSDDMGQSFNVIIDRRFFDVYVDKSLVSQVDKRLLTDRSLCAFDFAYCLTVHSAQGSEWDNVLIYDAKANQDYRKWLYTAITRAAKKCVLADRPVY